MAERRGLVLGARIASGTVAAGIAVAAIAAVALLPLPSSTATPRTVEVTPAPADQVRVCPGAAVRLGDVSGADADQAFVIGAPTVEAAVADGDLERSRLASDDDTAAAAAAPEVLRVPPPEDALVGGAQTQDVDAPDFRGLAAEACAEPTGSAWLVGGATTVGRSTFLVLANPTEVDARVTLQIFGEEGPVSAPGLAGILVPAGAQRVLSLAGFAPGLSSPVVHVTARGGRVVASLQQSIVRGLDAVGVESIGAGADPATALVVPGVRLVDTVGTTRATALVDWQDVVPVVRLGVPGDADGTVTVRVVPEGGDAIGTSFELAVAAGEVADVPLDAAVEEGAHAPDEEGAGEEHAHGLVDGVYTVFVDADVPVVAAVRASTAADVPTATSDIDTLATAPPSDLAWFAAAPALDGGAVLAVPPGPAPLVSIANPTAETVEVELAPLGGGDPVLVTVPAGGAATLGVAPGSYRLGGSEGLAVAVSYAAVGRLASFTLAPDRPVAGAVVVHPD